MSENGESGSKLESFRPQTKNSNRHTVRGMRELEKSIQRDGYLTPITTVADGECIDGSARLETVATVFDGVEPIIIHSRGDRPIIHVRDDIPDTNDPRAKRLATAANIISKINFDPDPDILAALASEDGAIAELVRQDDELLKLIGQGEKKSGLDHTLSHGYFEGDERAPNYKKLCYRIETMYHTENNLAVELYAGRGQLTYWYKRRFKNVICVDKIWDEHIDYSMPADKFIARKLASIGEFDLVDFDDEGSPAKEIKLFFETLGERSRPFILAFTDGIMQTMMVRGMWTPANYCVGDSPKAEKATDENFANCLEIVQAFIERIAAPRFKIDWLALVANSNRTAVYGTCLVSPV